jgi:hypothetical protein
MDIALSTSTNGLYLLPKSITASPVDAHGQNTYYWEVQLVNEAGATNPINGLISSYGSAVGVFGIVPPYVDGRVQLKQNLAFLLRAGLADISFQYEELELPLSTVYPNPQNYAYAGFVQNPTTTLYPNSVDVLVPFENNYLYRNFVYSLSDVDGSGQMTTGVYALVGNVDGEELALSTPPTYQFQSSMISGTSVPAVLGTVETNVLASYPLGGDGSEIGVSMNYDQNGNLFYTMTNDVQNIFGLPFLATDIVWGNSSGESVTLSAGNTIEDNSGGYLYPDVAQPQFQTVEYDWLAIPSLRLCETGGIHARRC